MQENVIRIIIQENDGDKALNYVKDTIAELKSNKIPLDKVIISTQLQKELSGYDAIGPHVAVARRMKAQGYPVGQGSIIKFVIIKGNDIIRERARLLEEVSQNDYDSGYYINNQVIPAVERIFDVIGIRKERLLDAEQSKLDKFFG